MGEEVLQSIIALSPQLLQKKDGLLVIVSEFMNPPGTRSQEASPAASPNTTIKDDELGSVWTAYYNLDTIEFMWKQWESVMNT